MTKTNNRKGSTANLCKLGAYERVGIENTIATLIALCGKGVTLGEVSNKLSTIRKATSECIPVLNIVLDCGIALNSGVRI